MNKPEKIIIHHSLTEDGDVVDYDAIKRYHVETNGWKDIGYQWVIEKVNGVTTVIKGRDESTSGAHCKEEGMNSKSIGICFVGNYDLERLPQDLFDEGVELIKSIRSRYGELDIEPHSKYATYKSCPGTKFQLDELIEACKDEVFDWKQDNALWLHQNGFTSQLHDGYENVDYGTLGAILRNAKEKGVL